MFVGREVVIKLLSCMFVFSESLQLGSIIKALETQTHELKTALSGMRDVVNNSNSNSINNNNSEITPPAMGRGRSLSAHVR